jgi:hypothetical protein
MGCGIPLALNVPNEMILFDHYLSTVCALLSMGGINTEVKQEYLLHSPPSPHTHLTAKDLTYIIVTQLIEHPAVPYLAEVVQGKKAYLLNPQNCGMTPLSKTCDFVVYGVFTMLGVAGVNPAALFGSTVALPMNNLPYKRSPRIVGGWSHDTQDRNGMKNPSQREETSRPTCSHPITA